MKTFLSFPSDIYFYNTCAPVSSVVIDVVNKISGIKNITYEIYDKSKQLSVRTGTVLPTVLEAPSALGPRKRVGSSFALKLS